MVVPTLTFLSWARERIGELATATEDGRARAQTQVTLTGTDAAGAVTRTETRTVTFLLAGPADVAGLKRRAVAGRYPSPGTSDAESDKCTHVEFADPALPWRYTPVPNPQQGTGALPAWLALVVGVEEVELTLVGDRVILGVEVQQQHPLAGPTPSPWAHVQIDQHGRRSARVLSGRRLEAGQEYLAVLVPAYRPDGGKAWTGTSPVTLPVYDRWRFRTATPAGSFRDLAARLEPGEAPDGTGRAPVSYPRLPTAEPLEVRGALVPIGSTEALLADNVADDLATLLAPRVDEAGRPVVGLPRYGEPWVPEPEETAWGAALNGDPRHRGTAGLGLELGIRLQEELMAEVVAHAGALDVAAQRVADVVLGLEASRALWDRRLPADPQRRLWVLGPGLRRVVTNDGPVDALATADDRALPRGLFSSAARRVLRPGPARTTALQEGAPDPSAILTAANRCPPPPEASEDGVPLSDVGVDGFGGLLGEVIGAGAFDAQTLIDALDALDLDNAPGELPAPAIRLRGLLVEAARTQRPAPYVRGLELVLSALGVAPDDEKTIEDLLNAVHELIERFDELGVDLAELLTLLRDMVEPEPDEPPCEPVDLEQLADGVVAAFDPTGPAAPARRRVLATIDGLDPSQPLAPPEVCAALPRPVWRDVSEQFSEWLLPGVGQLPANTVTALASNPVFIDALLVGYNTQLLGEAHWRNHHIPSGCTPLRVFWGRADVSTGDPVDDIVGIHSWSETSELGEPAHRPGGTAAGDLVLVFRGELFQRYPRTLLYLTSAGHDGAVDFDTDPDSDAARVLPTFQGRIGADVTFFGFHGVPAEATLGHWVVLEEPPQGYRFYNAGEVTPPEGADGAAFAKAAFARPVRVLIRGDRLAPGAPP